VASNFPGVPAPGVLRVDNTFGNRGEGQNTIAPMLGFAWQMLPGTRQFVLRGGYGIFYSRPTGQAFYQNMLGAPFSVFRLNTGGATGQANLDLAISKAITFNWFRENNSVTFRAEFYNALNNPQFANPDNNFTSPTFGLISSTAVNPRVMQLALRFAF